MTIQGIDGKRSGTGGHFGEQTIREQQIRRFAQSRIRDVCPFCDGLLHATSDHMLVVPEGDLSRRRHAHTECVVAERRAGRLPDQDEWRKSPRRR